MGTQPVAVVSEDLAQNLWPGANAIGQRIVFATMRTAPLDPRARQLREQPYVVVGVARSSGPVWQRGRSNELIVSRRQLPVVTDLHLVVRTKQTSPEIVRELTAAVQRAAPELSFTAFKSTQQYFNEHPGDAKGLGVGSAIGGIVALGLACVGMFAVVAFAVAQRSREIGIRLALGATQRNVVTSFFREGMKLALIGFAIGIPVSLAVMRIAEANDNSVRVLGFMPVAAVVLGLLVVAMAAAWLPARRAARVDPMSALRSD
jgi:ABC-type lipoprotein release transport system permease subunit